MTQKFGFHLQFRHRHGCLKTSSRLAHTCCICKKNIWTMVNTHYMVDGHPIHNKDPYNGYYKSLWTIGWLAPINGY